MLSITEKSNIEISFVLYQNQSLGEIQSILKVYVKIIIIL